jgi:hypothetical protein
MQKVQLSTWPEVACQHPGLVRFAEEAVEAAGNGWTGWPKWLPTFSGFYRLFTDDDCARRVALDYLTTLFHRERDRLRHSRRAP